MSFSRLTELLALREGPIKDFMGGYNAAKGDLEKAKATAKKNQELLNKEQTRVVKELLNKFLTGFFDNFPNFDINPTLHDIQQQITTRAQAKIVFEIIKKLHADLTATLEAMNRSLKGSKKIDADTLAKCIAQGEKQKSVEPRGDLVNFVKKEADFFKRLIKVDDEFNLKKQDFNTLLSLKLNATKTRYPDAVCALNIILAFMIEEVNGFLNQIAIMGNKLPKEKTEV